MQVLIAGGSGLVGTALTRRLLADGHSVTILSRNPAAHQAQPGVSFVGWDGRTTEGWGHLLNQADAVINLAGVNLGRWVWTKKRKEQLIGSRLNTGKALVEAFKAAERKPEVLVQASAVGYYRAAGDTFLDESSLPGSDFQGSLCQMWEESTKEVEGLGVRRVIIRSGVVFERGAFLLFMLLLPFRMFVGGPLGGGKQYLSWIHIQDEVEGILFLLNNRQTSGACNLMSPNPMRNDDLGRVIGRVLKRSYWFPVPAFALKAVLGEMSSVVLGSWRGVPTRLTDAGFTFKFPEVEAALRDLLGSK